MHVAAVIHHHYDDESSSSESEELYHSTRHHHSDNRNNRNNHNSLSDIPHYQVNAPGGDGELERAVQDEEEDAGLRVASSPSEHLSPRLGSSPPSAWRGQRRQSEATANSHLLDSPRRRRVRSRSHSHRHHRHHHRRRGSDHLSPSMGAGGRRPSTTHWLHSSRRRRRRSGHPEQLQLARSTRQLAAEVLQEKTLQQRIFLFFDAPESSRAAQYLSMFIMFCILASSVSFVLETVPPFRVDGDDDEQAPAFLWIEIVTIFVFSLEYLMRLLTVSAMPMLYVDPTSEEAKAQAKAVVGNSMLDFSQTRKTALKSGSVDDFLSGKPVGDVVRLPDAPASFRCLAWEFTPRKMWRFFRDPLNLIDVLAIMPFYLSLAINGDPTSSDGFAIIRLLRLARVVRIFKLGKYSKGVQLVPRVMNDSLPALTMLSYFMIIAVVLFASLIYEMEAGDYNEEKGIYERDNELGDAKEESPFKSILHSFWWVVVTATTVGYGDMVPTSPGGKAIATVCMYLGILVLALPITIIGMNFTRIVEEESIFEEMDQEVLHKTAAKQVARRSASTLLLSECLKAAETGAAPVQPKDTASKEGSSNAQESILLTSLPGSVNPPIRTPVQDAPPRHSMPPPDDASDDPDPVPVPDAQDALAQLQDVLAQIQVLTGRANKLAQLVQQVPAVPTT